MNSVQEWDDVLQHFDLEDFLEILTKVVSQCSQPFLGSSRVTSLKTAAKETIRTSVWEATYDRFDTEVMIKARNSSLNTNESIRYFDVINGKS